MAIIDIKTKFDVGDSAFGFVDGEIHNVIIDRIEIGVERYCKEDPTQVNRITYLATTTDAQYKRQCRFPNETLYTEDELKEYVNNYFNYFDKQSNYGL